jgi:hypothetical protein
VPRHRRANRQSPDKKSQHHRENLKSGSRPKIFGNNHIKTGKSKTVKTGLG